MNRLKQITNEQSGFNQVRDIGVNRAISMKGAFSVKRAFSPQKVTTVFALVLLLVAVQVSTQSVGDWFVFGLNILELTEPLSEVSDVGASVSTNVTGSVTANAPDFIQKIVMTLVEYVLD
ncbi:hypothetical protein [uncultured Shewanella sp.]|uniref:hypothetical protein n=1 Tax=Shewanella atlantica TaxID=271099 RepID=UPI002607286A|nr:hypothetical protein [uncultured Shewanella sp.]